MSHSSKRLEELSFFNAIACLLVVFIHVSSYSITYAVPDSLEAALLYFPWRLSAFVVPAFLFSGALKMALRFEEHTEPRSYLKYITGRFRAIYLPYVVWSIVYLIAFVSIGYATFSPAGFVRDLIWGRMASPFYYIVITMQFYLLRPFWNWTVKHIPWHTAIPISVLITFTASKLNSILSLWELEFPYVDRIFPTYLVFWVLGLYAGRNYEKVRDYLETSTGGIVPAIVVVVLFAFVPYLQYSRGIWLFDMTYFKVFTDILSIVVLLRVCLMLRSAAHLVKKVLSFISSASFSVYLSHCLFLTLATHFLLIGGIQKISIILIVRFLVCYSLPFALYGAGQSLRSITKKR